MLGGNAGSERDDMRARLLLDVHCGLDQGEARVPALQAGDSGAACFAVEGIRLPAGEGGDDGRLGNYRGFRYIG